MTSDENRNYLAWKGWEGAAFGRYTAEESLYFKAELHRAGVGSLSGTKILELGFGNGAFATWTRELGGQWTGIETNPALLDRAREAGFAARSPEHGLFAAVNDVRQDLVVAFDVLEHLPLEQIRVLLGDAKKILRSGGLLVARVPSGDSPFSGSIFHGDLTHVTLLGSSAIQQLALEAGFHVVQIRPPAFPIWGLGTRRLVRRAAVRVVRRLASAVIAEVLIGNEDAVITPNLVFVLRSA
jgi:SAM-dependent methyltransferase